MPAKDDKPVPAFAEVEEFFEWLRRHPADLAGIWSRHFKKDAGRASIPHPVAVKEALKPRPDSSGISSPCFISAKRHTDPHLAKSNSTRLSSNTITSRYIDGFVIPISKDNIGRFRATASQAATIWIEHRAPDRIKAVGDDLDVADQVPFAKIAGAGSDEPGIFSHIFSNQGNTVTV